MSTTYILHYFPGRGRAEAIRLFFAMVGAPFEDRRIAGPEWGALKPEVPLGRMPYLLEVSPEGNRQIPQSAAILRHLARRYDRYGVTPDDQLRADIVSDTAVELRDALSSVRFGPAASDPALKAKFEAETLPPHVARMAHALALGPSSGWFAAAEPTFADALAFDALESARDLFPTSLDAHPSLVAFLDRFAAVPGVREYLADRKAGGR
jgi:glutathione S-transferase